MRRVVPSKGSFAFEAICKAHKLDSNKYNPWDYLDYIHQFVQDTTNGLPLHDGYERIYFYKEIPEQVIRYDL
ncbi:MAG: hypothetical protein HFE57_14205 [Firmicutes bacterium]|jgi:hypothetical protein|nr:hypothetical protein [Bacillota bacterium]